MLVKDVGEKCMLAKTITNMHLLEPLVERHDVGEKYIGEYV